jgi:ankyrin repeat protein
VKALLTAGAEPNTSRNSGETALMTCARSGRVEAVRALVDAGADVRAVEKSNGQNALMWAAARNNAEVVQYLLTKGADLKAKTTGTGFTPLLFAAREGAMGTAKVLLDAGADINEPSSTGFTPLIAATFTAKWDLAKYLLERGADPNKSGAGFNALHWAAGSWENDISGSVGPEGYAWIAGLGPGKLDLVKALLAHGANPNAKMDRRPPKYGYGSGSRLNVAGATPFLLAAVGAKADIMKALLAAGADPHLTTEDGTTALMTAAGYGRIHGESRATADDSLDAVKVALQAGIDINAANRIGETALHAATYYQKDAVVSYLLEQGANVNAMNQRGETPLVLAEGFTGSDTGGNTFYSDSTAAILKKAGGSNRMQFLAELVQLETPCPAPTLLVHEAVDAGGTFRANYGSALRIRPKKDFVIANTSCEALSPGATLKITGTRLGHFVDSEGKPWDGGVDASTVEFVR